MRSHIRSSALLCLLGLAACGSESDSGLASDPIAQVGHGALIGADGKTIVPDRDFTFAVQDLYLRQLEAQAGVDARARLADARERLAQRGLGTSDEERAFVNRALIRWLARAAKAPELQALEAKNEALYLAYLPGEHPEIDAVLSEAGIVLARAGAGARDVASYANDCRNAGVPVPPDWGSSLWQWSGQLTTDFLGSSSRVDVYYYTSSSPRGTCIALPRSTGSTISLLGIICHGVDTSKACFWDNSNVAVGSSVPLSSFRNGGSSELVSAGGNCTACHAGNNPYIIHPNTALDLSSKVPNESWTTKNWYDPLIVSNQQNPGPTNAIAALTPPAGQGSCALCHNNNLQIRLPDLSTTMSSYCGTVLGGAIARTMPPQSPGAGNYTAHIQALQSRCNNTQASQLCSPDNAKICAQAGGYCEQAFSTGGARHDLCRWPTATSEGACNSTAGIWTTPSSGFAQGWPSSVPPGASGACITQMRNIGGTRATLPACTDNNREICRKRGGFCGIL